MRTTKSHHLKNVHLSTYRQIRQGIANNTKGTCYVVYEDVQDAKIACDKLNGFNFQNRYLVCQSCCAVPTGIMKVADSMQASIINLRRW